MSAKSSPSGIEVNSVDYWNRRFEGEWESRGGPDQTRFFAEVCLDALPDWAIANLRRGKRTLVDIGCAQGQAYVSLARRFPRLAYVGTDVSAVAVEKARADHDGARFGLLDEDWSNLPAADFGYCSNTLEHLADWRHRIELLCRHCTHGVFLLVPYREGELDPEHVVRFDERSFPVEAGGRRLLFLRVVDTSVLPGSRWNGNQILAVYGPAAKPARPGSVPSDPDLTAGLDLRGLTLGEIDDLLVRRSAAEVARGRSPAPATAPAAPGEVARINAEWEQKFNAMVAAFEAKHREAASQTQQTIGGLEARLRTVAEESAKEIRQLLRERDIAQGEITLFERKLAMVEDLHGRELEHLRGVAEREAGLRAEAASLDLVREAQTRKQESDAKDAELARLTGLLDRLEADHAARSSLLSEERALAVEETRLAEEQLAAAVEAHAHDLARLQAAGEAEVARLTGLLDRLEADHAAHSSRLTAERALAVEEMHLTEKQLATAIRSHAHEIERLQAVREAEAARFNIESAGYAEQIRSLEADGAASLAAHRDVVADHEAEIARLRAQADEAAEEHRRLVEAQLAGEARHAEDVERLRAAHAAEIAALTASLDAANADHAGALERLRAAHAAELAESAAASAERVAEVRAVLEATRRTAELHEANSRETREHYEGHLDGINRYVDRVSQQAAEAIEDLTRAADLRFEEVVAIALNNTRVAQEAIERSARSEDGRSSIARAIGDLFRRGAVAAPPGPLIPVDAPRISVGTLPAAQGLREILAALAYRRNISGSSAHPRETPAPVVEEAIAPPPAAVEKAEKAGDPPRVAALPADPPGGSDVIAMQLEVFDTGGLERVVFDLGCGFRDHGRRTLVLCRRDGVLAAQMREQGIDVHVFDGPEQYRALLERHGVTHLLLHHSYFGFDIASSLGIRVYDVVHNTYFWKDHAKGEVGNVGRACAGVICVSSAVRDFHARVFDIPVSKTVVVNNPINKDGLIIPDREQLRLIRSGFNHTTFVNVANLYPAKAQVGMLSAFARAHRDHPEIRLLIAGAEADRTIGDELRRLIDVYGLQDAAFLLGSCDRRRIGRLYCEAHAFLLPSVFEGYSVSAVEAASFGLPLVMTDVGGARDLIEENDCGILLPPIVTDLARCDEARMREIALSTENDTTPHLVGAIEEIARNRDRWIERGFAGMTKPLSLDAVVERYLALMRAPSFETVQAG